MNGMNVFTFVEDILLRGRLLGFFFSAISLVLFGNNSEEGKIFFFLVIFRFAKLLDADLILDALSILSLK